MISAEIYAKYPDIKITLSGHAGYAPLGSDIVCAGVSSLIMAFDSLLTDCCEREASRGFYRVKIKDRRSYGKLRAYLEFLISGLTGIERRYPENVSCKIYVDSLWDENIGTSEKTMKKRVKGGKGNGY